MGDYTQAFTVDGYYRSVREVTEKYWIGLGYTLKEREADGNLLVFSRGRLRKNILTFSFDEAYKEVFIQLVPNRDTPVTSLEICFSIPWMVLRKLDIESIQSIIKAFHKYLLISLANRPY